MFRPTIFAVALYAVACAAPAGDDRGASAEENLASAETPVWQEGLPSGVFTLVAPSVAAKCAYRTCMQREDGRHCFWNDEQPETRLTLRRGEDGVLSIDKEPDGAGPAYRGAVASDGTWGEGDAIRGTVTGKTVEFRTHESIGDTVGGCHAIVTF